MIELETLKRIHDEFSKRYSEYGKVAIAGGSVRDTLMGKDPQDYDVFLLYDFNIGRFQEMKEKLSQYISDLQSLPPVVEWHQSEPYLVATVKFEGNKIQILCNPMEDVEKLLDTFDWNVCLFAYDGEKIIKRTQVEDIGPSKELKLQKVTFPLSTLRRGFRFSERFLMKLPRKTVIELCEKIIENSKKGKDKTPHGNEPDMISLEKNILVD